MKGRHRRTQDQESVQVDLAYTSWPASAPKHTGVGGAAKDLSNPLQEAQERRALRFRVEFPRMKFGQHRL